MDFTYGVFTAIEGAKVVHYNIDELFICFDIVGAIGEDGHLFRIEDVGVVVNKDSVYGKTTLREKIKVS